MKETIRISVRNFVEFLLRTGDIDDRRGNLGDKDAMLMGSRIHRKIQKAASGDYVAEVTLKCLLGEGENEFWLEGRADGIFTEENLTYIDEIKGVFEEVEDIEEPYLLHLAQAKCYAFIVSKERELDSIGVQMTYVNLDTEEIKRIRSQYQRSELEEWMMELTKEYKKWMKLRKDHYEERNKSIKKLEFPFEYREGQEKLVKDVYRSILRKKKLFIEAPTGVGKTISTVFPAVKAVGEELSNQIFYLTAKTMAASAATKCFGMLIDKGLLINVLHITAKDKICFLEERSCNPVDCIYAKGYFDRVNDAVYEFLTTYNGLFTREKIMEFARERQLCPFEFSLDVSLFCDAIVCDYNYAFDPNVYLKRFFSEGVKGDYLFLIDEAHNLVDRGRNMYSAVLYKDDFLMVKQIMLAANAKAVVKALTSCNKILLSMKKECEEYKVLDSFSPLLFALLRLSNEFERFFKYNKNFDGGEAFAEFYFNLRHFLNMADIMGEDFLVYTEHDENGKFCIHLSCVETGRVLTEKTNNARASVFFSATLLPIKYYTELLSMDEEVYAIYANSIFDRKQRALLIANDVSSKYTRRNENEYKKIASYIKKMTNAKRGNYLCFFPSYSFMSEVMEYVEISDYDIISQTREMTELKKEEFLNRFSADEEKPVLGMCVMGGAFAEGIDLTEDKLIGVVIVGTGLPMISHEREVLKEYYDSYDKDGFDYSYRIPGMNKVEQAAGRVIRTSEDRGVILLLDERFHQRSNRDLFPREWDDYKTVSINTVSSELTNFWK